MRPHALLLAVALITVAGCQDESPLAVRDVTPPAAPRGLTSITGDHTVYLSWLDNTEPDLAGYRLYSSTCPDGPDCPYLFVGATTGDAFTVSGLPNGVTRYYAVTAVDHEGNESPLSYELLSDTPRPEGFGSTLEDYYLAGSPASGWDFSIHAVRSWDDPVTDMFFGFDGQRYVMFVPDFQTDIQDAGMASNLDAVDVAPAAGWSPSGSAELIEGHCYVVWTRDDHYAKFQVTRILPPTASRPATVVFDWAYQVAVANPQLGLKPLHHAEKGLRPRVWAPRS